MSHNHPAAAAARPTNNNPNTNTELLSFNLVSNLSKSCCNFSRKLFEISPSLTFLLSNCTEIFCFDFESFR